MNDNMKVTILGKLEDGETVATIRIDNVVYICKTSIQTTSNFKGVQPEIKMYDEYKQEYDKNRNVLKTGFVEPGDTSIDDIDKQIDFIKENLPKIEIRGVDANDHDIKR